MSTLAELEILRADTQTADIQDEALFHVLMRRGIALLDLDDRALAHEFGMSVPSARRWVAGRNAPAPPMRPSVYKRLCVLIDQKLSAESCSAG